MPTQDIAIIGAGLCGMTLSLFLKRNGYSVTIYELRSSSTSSDGSGGAIALSPNGLRALDAIGLLENITNNGYKFQKLVFRNNEHEYLDAYEVGNHQKYGHDSFRVYRRDIVQVLRTAVEEANIPIVYSQKFSHVVAEEDDGDGAVRFITVGNNGQEEEEEEEEEEEKGADILIGADGIHSTVRRYLWPEIQPKFTNMVAISCTASTNDVRFPSDSYHASMPVSIHGPAGAVHIAPQKKDGSELFVAINWPTTTTQTREGWESFGKDKQRLREIMLANGSWENNSLVASAIDTAPLETFSLWPFYTVPKLDKWCSAVGRVLILGDAAHAIPPTGGQGLNQGLEDVLSLSLLLNAVRDGKVDLKTSLNWWQEMRQKRVDRVIELAKEISARRRPGWTGENAENIDSSWLFQADVSKFVEDWVRKQG